MQTLSIPRGDYGYGYDAATGQLTSITAPDGGTLGYGYDGSLLTNTTWSGEVAGSVTRSYDNDFRVISLSVNGVDPVANTYDDDSLLIQAGDLDLTRDAQNGLLTGTSLGNLTDTLNYNVFGELADRTYQYSGTDLYAIQYSYDALGWITRKVETVQGVTTTYDYAYDPAGRLAEVQTNGVVTASYTYDANGNRLSAPGLTTNPVYDDQDRLLQYGDATYTYTANGELLTKTEDGQTTSYAYDVLGNLIRVDLPDSTVIEYAIDAKNRRVGKKVDGTSVQGFLYQDQLKPVAELDGAGNIVSRFIYATGENMLAYMVKGGVIYRIVTDHLGSPRMVVDTATGSVAQRMDYDVFGRVLSYTNPGFQPFGFAGGLHDQYTQLTRFGLRDYDAHAGRWTAKDPILFAGLDTNLFGYVANDPVNSFDRYGLFNWKDWLWDKWKSKAEEVLKVCPLCYLLYKTHGEVSVKAVEEGVKNTNAYYDRGSGGKQYHEELTEMVYDQLNDSTPNQTARTTDCP